MQLVHLSHLHTQCRLFLCLCLCQLLCVVPVGTNLLR